MAKTCHHCGFYIKKKDPRVKKYHNMLLRGFGGGYAIFWFHPWCWDIFKEGVGAFSSKEYVKRTYQNEDPAITKKRKFAKIESEWRKKHG